MNRHLCSAHNISFCINLGVLVYLCTLFALASTYRYLPESPTQLAAKVKLTKEQLSERHRPTYIADVPYFVTVLHENRFCSGTLISSRVILTTATCVSKIDLKLLTHTVVKVGSDVLAGEGTVVAVVDIKIHEYYQTLSIIDNDVALVILAMIYTVSSGTFIRTRRLKTPFNKPQSTVPFSSRVKKALLIEPDTALRDDLPITMIGWGNEDDRAKEQIYRLVKTSLSVMGQDQCFKILPHLITLSTFCGVYIRVLVYIPKLDVNPGPGEKEQPLGDIGGPVVFTTAGDTDDAIDRVVGLTIYNGINISVPEGTVAVITNVSHFHRWIYKNTVLLMAKYCVVRPIPKSQYTYFDFL